MGAEYRSGKIAKSSRKVKVNVITGPQGHRKTCRSEPARDGVSGTVVSSDTPSRAGSLPQGVV
ncbi:hypothetical protein EI969_22690 [Pseudomonas sp. PB101]|nr:hypothetical protein [Pseudomonas sp. PB101]